MSFPFYAYANLWNSHPWPNYICLEVSPMEFTGFTSKYACLGLQPYWLAKIFISTFFPFMRVLIFSRLFFFLWCNKKGLSVFSITFSTILWSYSFGLFYTHNCLLNCRAGFETLMPRKFLQRAGPIYCCFDNKGWKVWLDYVEAHYSFAVLLFFH